MGVIFIPARPTVQSGGVRVDQGSTRARILSVAREKFARLGFHGASMDSIVRAAGLSKGAVYWHFKNKEALFVAVMESELRRIQGYILPKPEDERKGPKAFFTESGERCLEILSEDKELRLLWIDLVIQAQRGKDGGNRFSTFIRNKVEETSNKLISESLKVFPQLENGNNPRNFKDVLKIGDYFFMGLMMNLGITLSLEEAKTYWREMMERLFGGEGIDERS